MTEAEWQNCGDWRPMLEFLKGNISYRKGTLYICAGLREIWHLLYSESSRQAVDTGELAADGGASADEISWATYGAECPTFGHDFSPKDILERRRNGGYDVDVKRLIQMGVYDEAFIQGEMATYNKKLADQTMNAAHIAYHFLYDIRDGNLGMYLIEHLNDQNDWPRGWLVREIFGNPFRTADLPPGCTDWKGGIVSNIARRIYDERAFDLMPILGDALEESGCRDTALLDHCRHSDRHAHGCWVIDRILGL